MPDCGAAINLRKARTAAPPVISLNSCRAPIAH